MLDPNTIRNQTHIDSEHVTRTGAAEISSAERWTPHVRDGLDAFEGAVLEEESKKWSQVIAQACRDAAFRQRLIDDPASALRTFGIAAPADSEIRFVEDTPSVKYIALPSLGACDAELRERDLATIASSCALATCNPRLPQTWADTWIA